MKRLLAGLMTMSLGICSWAHAAEFWPSRVVTIVAPGAAGGTADTFARLLSELLANDVSKPVIVENRAGVGTLLGSQYVAQAKSDGHTLLLGAAALTIGPHIYKSIALDPTRDLQPIRLLAKFPNLVIVNAGMPIRSVSELVEKARSNPGRFNFSSGGVGISEHLSGELFKSMTGTDIVHVPYKSSAESVRAVLKGEVLVAFANVPLAMPHVRAGKLRALAVTSSNRSSSLPDIPTIAEAVSGYELSTWFGLLAPVGTPSEIVQVLNKSTMRLTSTVEFKERLRSMGADPADEGPAAFAELIRKDWEKWGALVRKANIRSE